MERNPEGRLLIIRDGTGGMLLGTESKEPKAEGVWYMGLLAVGPDTAEAAVWADVAGGGGRVCAGARSGRRMRMAVLRVRDTLDALVRATGVCCDRRTGAIPLRRRSIWSTFARPACTFWCWKKR